MLTIGWLAVILGVLATQWADGRFPFSNAGFLASHLFGGRSDYALAQ